MMSSLATGKMPGVPGMPTARKQASRQASKKKGSGRRVSGNPAKRNAQLSAEPTAVVGIRPRPSAPVSSWTRSITAGDGRFPVAARAARRLGK